MRISNFKIITVPNKADYPAPLSFWVGGERSPRTDSLGRTGDEAGLADNNFWGETGSTVLQGLLMIRSFLELLSTVITGSST